jgi:hypothetical protein
MKFFKRLEIGQPSIKIPISDVVQNMVALNDNKPEIMSLLERLKKQKEGNGKFRLF